MAKSIGIIGGLGPKTAFQFAQRINDRYVAAKGVQPDLLLENLPVSDKLMERMTKGEDCADMLELMLNSICKLNRTGVDLIVIPCNTVHVFIEPLRKASAIPILSIIEETAKVCREKKLKTMGILASNTTIKQSLYAHELARLGIKIVIPPEENQDKINEIIFRINRNNSTIDDKNVLIKIINSLREQGAEKVLLACTDLQQIVSLEDTSVPLLDSFAILEEAAFNFLIEKYTIYTNISNTLTYFLFNPPNLNNTTSFTPTS